MSQPEKSTNLCLHPSHTAIDRTRPSMRVFRWTVLVFGALAAGCNSGPTESAKERLAKAEAMFAERCKKAGVFIHRTVDNVEGVLLLKLRPEAINYGHTAEQQFRLDDPYAVDAKGELYIKFFLRGSWKEEFRSYVRPPALPEGYSFVDAVDPKDGKRYRYTGSVREYEITESILGGGTPGRRSKRTGFVLDRTEAPDPAPRYGVTYDDLSTREEREFWIAGSSLRVIDLQTNEVLAERVGYMMDRGQGNNSGGRAPWSIAQRSNSCPPVSQTHFLIERVLRPATKKRD